MVAIKIPKKFRMACYDVMDDKEGALEALEPFRAKFPHQVTAVHAEVAYFDGNFQQALDLGLTVLPWLDEWYYCNVRNEHIAAMTTVAMQLHRASDLMKIFENEKERLQAENADRQRIFFLNAMIECLHNGVFPCNHLHGSADFEQAENPKTKDELWAKIKTDDKKIKFDTESGRRTLFTYCRLQGHPQDALELFEKRLECNDNMSELDYIEAIKLYRLFKKFDKAIEIVELNASSRLWHVAAATQVRPMKFFLDPVLCPYVLDKYSLSRIRHASCMNSEKRQRK